MIDSFLAPKLRAKGRVYFLPYMTIHGSESAVYKDSKNICVTLRFDRSLEQSFCLCISTRPQSVYVKLATSFIEAIYVTAFSSTNHP